jgi:hypothetical protein
MKVPPCCSTLGRLVALGHHPVARHLAIAREQSPDFLERLLVVASGVPIRLAFVAHRVPPPSSGI